MVDAAVRQGAEMRAALVAQVAQRAALAAGLDALRSSGTCGLDLQARLKAVVAAVVVARAVALVAPRQHRPSGQAGGGSAGAGAASPPGASRQGAGLGAGAGGGGECGSYQPSDARKAPPLVSVYSGLARAQATRLTYPALLNHATSSNGALVHDLQMRLRELARTTIFTKPRARAL